MSGISCEIFKVNNNKFNIPHSRNFCESPMNMTGKKFVIFSFATRSRSLTTPHTISCMGMVTLAANSSCIEYQVSSSLGDCINFAVVKNAINTRTDL